MTPRIVITGIGAITAVGIGDAFIPGLATASPPTGAEPLAVSDFAVEDYLDTTKTYLDRASEFALASANLALKQAGVVPDAETRWRRGIALGTAYGCLDTMEKFTEALHAKGARLANPLLFSHSYANTPTGLAAIEYQLAGPHATFCSGALASADALAFAVDTLRAGRADVMVAGGFEVLSEPRRQASEEQPPLGEGAAAFILETADHAEKRGARVYGRILAIAAAGPSAVWKALERAAAEALALARVDPKQITAAWSASPCRRVEGWQRAGLAHLIPTAIPVRHACAIFGSTEGAGGALALAAALAQPGVALVSSVDRTGACVCMVVGA